MRNPRPSRSFSIIFLPYPMATCTQQQNSDLSAPKSTDPYWECMSCFFKSVEGRGLGKVRGRICTVKHRKGNRVALGMVVFTSLQWGSLFSGRRKHLSSPFLHHCVGPLATWIVIAEHRLRYKLELFWFSPVEGSGTHTCTIQYRLHSTHSEGEYHFFIEVLLYIIESHSQNMAPRKLLLPQKMAQLLSRKRLEKAFQERNRNLK